MDVLNLKKANKSIALSDGVGHIDDRMLIFLMFPV